MFERTPPIRVLPGHASTIGFFAANFRQENCKVRLNVAGTLRVPWRPRENAVISPRRLRHTECAYYFAVLLPQPKPSSANCPARREFARPTGATILPLCHAG